MAFIRARWLVLAAAAAVLVLHALAFNFVTDDAYISFVYSRNFAEHNELSFNLGQPVEGYTSFLWTVVIGLGMKAGLAPELLSLVLGTACAVGTLVVTFRLIERVLARTTWWACVPPLLLASSSGFACWSSGGLETQLFTLLVVASIDGVVSAAGRPGAIRRAAILLAFAAMTRPEGLLVAAALGLTHVISVALVWWQWGRRRFPSDELVAAMLFLVIWGAWFFWRYRYYGHLWPNTYYVKAAGEWTDPKLAKQSLDNGLYYVWVWVRQTKLLFALPLAVLGFIVGAPRSPRSVLAMASMFIAGGYLTYAVTVGGDFMGLHRFIMPVFVIAALAVTLGLEWVTSWFHGMARRIVAVTASVALVAAFALTQYQLTRDSVRWGNWANDNGLIDTPAFLIVYTADRAAIGRAMASCFRDDDFSIVGGAGAQPYYGRMRAIDVFGLVSDRIAHESPRSRARAGHTKWGADSLLAEYNPTFVFSCYAIHKTPTPPPLPCNVGFWIARGFQRVTMHIPGMRQSGEYYTFLASKARDFQCPGRVD
ncbi:MAG: hypothetical protein AB7O24_13165 [Kofleriaceae bacterium]